MPKQLPDQQRIEEQRDNLQLLNQVMRHDIRNDLQLIGAYAELLEEHVDEEGREYLKVIRENTKSASSLTTTARDLAQVMLSADGEERAVSLSSVLNQQIEETRSGHPEAVVTIEGSIPDIDVVGNDMLGSVFRNLLQNAIQHNDKELPEVTVSAVETDDRIQIHIEDNGPGIPDTQKEEIFGKAEKGLESSGAGIGLYLVQSLVDSYGGDVWVEDRSGDSSSNSRHRDDDSEPEGSVFVVSLPRA
ncbi:MAG: HAMP domain-containing sensor histidine kinase [Natronomonas sp.]